MGNLLYQNDKETDMAKGWGQLVVLYWLSEMVYSSLEQYQSDLRLARVEQQYQV